MRRQARRRAARAPSPSEIPVSDSTQPFEARFRLATPVALNHPWLHLDSLLAHAALLGALGREYYTLPTKRIVDTGEAWRRIGRPALACWRGLACASVSHFEPECEFRSLAYFKRFEEPGFPGERVNRGSGHFRDWMLRWTYLPAREVVFWGRGDVELVARLLRTLPAIGNDHRVGWGEVISVEIRAVQEDWSIVRDGRAQRPVPLRMLRACESSVPLAWRPPYWSPRHVEPCAPPGAAIEFSAGARIDE